LQQLLVLLLLSSVAMVLWIGHGHNWPGMQAIHVTHGSLMPHHTAAAAHIAVHKPQTLQKFMGNLDFPLWWHAPFIAQSGTVQLSMHITGYLLPAHRCLEHELSIMSSAVD
jgi:hypothetical protein